MRRFYVLAVVLGLHALLAGRPGSAAAQVAAPVDVRVPVPPSPFLAEGASHLVYELHVTNLGRSELALTAVVALDADGGEPLVEFGAEELVEDVRLYGVNRDSVAPPRLLAGRRAVVFMWVSVDPGRIPTKVAHRLSFGSEPETTDFTVEVEAMSVAGEAVPLGPPLRGVHLVAGNGPGNRVGHRRAAIPLDGRLRIAQRFAIDFVQVFDGSTHDGDPEDNTTYHAWGEEALAVADGVVVDVKDGIPENVPGESSRAVPITMATLAGNYVLLDIGDGRYAFYAHLQPGGLLVEVGDRVRRGDPVGLVGNSGNSTEPHLHFHVSDGPSGLAAEGVPYVFDAFETIGTWWFGEPFEPGEPVSHESELPLQNRVVNFTR